jgi:hypothetical protein
MATASLPAESIAQVPRAIDAPDMTIAAITHAEGVQIYECDFNASRKLVWRFREPVASLISNGNTIGRHYAGPNWEHVDGSAVTAKVAGSTPGTRPDDIPWLRLDVTATRGSGLFSRVSVVQRINTQGGILSGDCEEAGSHRSIVYSADYVFLRNN